MPSSAEIAANSSSYQGNAGLGGGGFGFERLDTKPIEDLARYTMLYNKSEYDQRQKNADEKILELAKLAPINLNDLHGKDREEVLGAYNDMMTYAKEYASKPADNPKDKVKQNLEYQLKLKALKDKYEIGKARAIKYTKELDEISKVSNPNTKKVKEGQLNELFNGTPVTELFKSLPQYETSKIDIPKPVISKITTFAIGDNEDAVVEGTIFNPKENIPLANVTELGIAKLYPAKGSPEYNKLSEEEKKQANVQETIESDAKVWTDMAATITSVLQSKDADGNLKYYTKDATTGSMIFNEDKFKTDNASNTLLMGNYNALQALSDYSKKKITHAKSGIFEDQNFRYKLPTTLSPTGDDFLPGVVDFNSGEIKPTQMILSAMYAQHGGDRFDKKLQLTGDQLDQERLRLTKRGQDLENSRFWAGFNKGSEEDLLNADAVIREASDVITTGVPRTVTYQKSGKVVKKDVIEIADPNLLKEFGTIDKDGTTSNVPDVIHYDEKTNKMSMVYYKKERVDPDKESTDKSMRTVSKDGFSIVDRQVEMQPTQWLGQITRRKNPNKDIGSINTLIDQVYNKYKRNLKEMAVGYKGGATIVDSKRTTESGRAGGSIKETPEERAKRIANE